MKLAFVIAFIASLFQFVASADDSIVKPQTINSVRLEHIRMRFSEYPTIQLPFSYRIQESQKALTNFYVNQENDTLIFGVQYDVSIIGTHKDTTNYFAFYYLVHGDDLVPAVVVFDKQGNVLTQDFLGYSCYQGCESACRSFVSISEDFEINFKHEEFEYTMYYDENDDLIGCSEFPESANGYMLRSRINKHGFLELIEKVTFTVEELMTNPIIKKGE